MKKLQMTFIDGDGKKHQLVHAAAAQDLTAETVQEQMTALAALGIFEKAEVKLFASAANAKYIDTIETVLF